MVSYKKLRFVVSVIMLLQAVGFSESLAFTGGFESNIVSTDAVELQDIDSRYGWGTPDNQKVLPDLSPTRESPTHKIKRVMVEGRGGLVNKDVISVVASFESRTLDAITLQQLVQTVAKYYRDQGYFDVVVALPEQQIDNGVVRLGVVENKITRVNLVGDIGRLNNFVRSRVNRVTDQPLRYANVNELFERIQYDRTVEISEALLLAGERSGESTLNLRLQSQPTHHYELTLDNYRSPSIGAEHASVRYINRNAAGYGDTAYFDGGISAGAVDLFGSYTFPVAANEMRITSFWEWQNAEIIEGDIAAANLSQRAQAFGVHAMQPVFNSSNHWNYGGGLEWRENQMFINSETSPFGENLDYWAFNASVSGYRVGEKRLWSFQAAIRLGFAITDRNKTLDDPSFQSLSGKAEIQQPLPTVIPSTAVARWNGLWGQSALPGAEKITLGGAHSVRGYRQSVGAFERGGVLTAEWQVRLNRFFKPQLGVIAYPFIDYGVGANIGESSRSYLGAGAGIAVNVGKSWLANLDWAYGTTAQSAKSNLQDYGIYFQLKYHYE